ncbi:MAG: monofunctional biosynthetic peptidoglycan transglycosylase [Betaproteobacteria bacterium]|jgi:monofunctional biosynthetic peptidoglycan transglycosylase
MKTFIYRTFTCFLILFILLQCFFAAQLLWYIKFNPHMTSFMSLEQARLKQQKPTITLKHTWLDYRQMPTSIKQAVITAEDSGFMQHHGVDWKALENAAKENIHKRKIMRGGSTISMQLSKNLFLSPKQSYLRKSEELIITGMLELTLSKRRIFEIYLNVAEWGVGIFGIEAAANHYFGIHASELSEYQAAWLATILPAPKRSDRFRDTPWVENRASLLATRMGSASFPK